MVNIKKNNWIMVWIWHIGKKIALISEIRTLNDK